MLKPLTETEERFYKVFRSHKSAYRAEAYHHALFTQDQVKELLTILEEKGYISANKLGHYKETTQAQKKRLGGRTAAQYVAEARAEQHRQNGEYFRQAHQRISEEG